MVYAVEKMVVEVVLIYVEIKQHYDSEHGPLSGDLFY